MTVRRYHIVHATHLTYSGQVSSSHNEVRMTPLTEDGQLTLESRLRVKPMTWSQVYRDYWSTHVTALEMLEPHSALEIESISTVERSSLDRTHHGLAWSDYQLDALKDQYFEYLMPSARTRLDPEVLYAFRSAVNGATPAEAASVVTTMVHDRVAYVTGSSAVSDDAQTAWDARRGVCQDLTHVALAALRGIGIPCRYVSGYLTPKRGLAVGESATGESHAWLEWWDGEWFGADPTNLQPVDLDHIVVARGRDYEDVAPMKGVYQGQVTSDMTVSVTIKRLS